MTIDWARRIDFLRRRSRLMDSACRVPGTGVRVGRDPIFGLGCGIGDVATPSFAAATLYQACRPGVPRVEFVRMLLNVRMDLVAGSCRMSAMSPTWRGSRTP